MMNGITLARSPYARLTRVLSGAVTRRAGIAALIAGLTGTAASSVDASRGAQRRHEKMACRSDQSQCTTNDECCSGICKAKPGSGTEFRCVGNHKKKKDNKKAGRDGGACVPLGDPWFLEDTCCAGLTDGYVDLSLVCCMDTGTSCSMDAECCGFSGIGGSTAACGTVNLSSACCQTLGSPCETNTDCCGYNNGPDSQAQCTAGTCTPVT